MSADSNPLGIYVHWPYCARLCPYCDFNIYKDKGGDDVLAAAIAADILQHAQLMGKRSAVSMHFGGGTPSLLAPKTLELIIGAAKEAFGFVAKAEIGLEANPDGFTRHKALDFAAAGINRLSLGVQSFDDAALRGLGRTHDSRQAFLAIEAACAGFDRVSIDLIYARPHQSIMSWRRELAQAVSTGVRHISPYQLTIEEGTAFSRAAKRGALRTPENDLAADFYDATQEILADAGLPSYEISNHAAALADQSLHNLLYWRAHDWVGVGPGAHGRIALKGARWATAAHASPEAYIAAVSANGVGWSESVALSFDEARAEAIMMGVRISEGVQLERWKINAQQAGAFVESGHAAIAGGRLALTGPGRLLADRIGGELAMRAAV